MTANVSLDKLNRSND